MTTRATPARGWAIQSPAGCILLGTVAWRRADAIDEVVIAYRLPDAAARRREWRRLRRLGFRAVRVTVEEM